MKNGLVGSRGQAGIKVLGKGIDIGGRIYKYEIKIKGKLGDYRVFGNYCQNLKRIVFDKFGKGVH